MKALNWIAPSVLLSALLILAVAANAASPAATLPISRNLNTQPILYILDHFTTALDALPASRNRPVVSDSSRIGSQFVSSRSFSQTDPCAAPISRSVKACN